MSQKDNDKAKKFSSSIPADAGKVNKITEKYRSHSSLTYEQYLQARRFRLPPFEFEFDQIAAIFNVSVEDVKIALRGIRTKNKNPKRGTLNSDPRSRDIILEKSHALNEPVYKILQRLIKQAKWDKEDID